MGNALHNFMRGVGSIIEIWPRNRAPRVRRRITVEQALSQDWIRVGDDLRGAMKAHLGEIPPDVRARIKSAIGNGDRGQPEPQPEAGLAPTPGATSPRVVSPQKASTDERRAGAYQGQIQIERSSSFRGPLPPPEVLTGYGSVNESFPERIVRMAEKEGDRRRMMEKKSLEADITHQVREDKHVDRAQWFGLISVLALVVGGAFLGGGPGALLGGSGLAGVIGAYFYGRHQEKSEPKPESRPSSEEPAND